MNPLASIIIPTFNEEKNIADRLSELRDIQDIEVIVCDGGSQDRTVEIAGQYSPDVRVVISEKGRALQMNTGARTANGKMLVFLHADTFLPQGSIRTLLSEMNDGVAAGAFLHAMKEPGLASRYLTFYGRIKSIYLRRPFGDQAIFMERKYFFDVGGYREDYTIFEDVDLIARIRRRPHFKILRAPVFTSMRRYDVDGYWTRAITNIVLQFLFALGVHPNKLSRWY